MLLSSKTELTGHKVKAENLEKEVKQLRRADVLRSQTIAEQDQKLYGADAPVVPAIDVPSAYATTIGREPRPSEGHYFVGL